MFRLVRAQVFIQLIPYLVRCSSDLNLPCISSDNFQGGFDAASYLISMGHMRIACIQGLQRSQPNNDRIRGFIEAHKLHGVPFDENLIVGNDFTVENGYSQTLIVLNTNNPPSAIFTLSNLISLGVIKALKEIGLNIPDDISLVSFDDQPYSEFLRTPMTTVNQQKSQIGKLAIEVLFNLINRKEFTNEAINIKLKTNLIIRNSVKKM